MALMVGASPPWCNALENLVLLRQMQRIRGASVIAAINGVVGGVGLALLVAIVVSLATGAAWRWDRRCSEVDGVRRHR
jgi:hypothetical protein